MEGLTGGCSFEEKVCTISLKWNFKMEFIVEIDYTVGADEKGDIGKY